MVIQAPTVLTAGGSGTDGLVFNTAIVNPDAQSLIAVFVEAGALASGENDIPVITDSIGLDWEMADTEVGYVGVWMRGTWFTAWAETSDTGNITFTFPRTQSSCHWHVLQIPGAASLDPVLQSISTAFNTTNNPSVNLPAPPDPTSLVLAAAMRNGTTPYTAGAGHTLLSSIAGSSNPAVGSDVSYDMAPAQQAVGFTTASGAQKTIFALEIAIGGAPPPPPPTPAEATLIRKWKQIETTADNVFELTAPHDIEIGETLVISINRVTGASPQPITGVTGIGTNVATVVATSTRASTMITGTIVIPITQKILNGTVLAVGITSGSPSRKAAVCSVWSGLTGAVNADSGNVFGSGPNGSGTVVSVATTASVPAVPALIIASFGHGSAGFTPDVGETLVDMIATAAGSTDRGVTQTSKVVTSTGVKTASGVLPTSGSWAANVIALPLASAAAGTPVADAGGDVIDVEPGDPIDFSADGSTGTGTLTYVWTQESGELVDFTTNGPDLHIEEAPWTIAGTTLVFKASVTDSGLTSTDTVSAIILPSEGRILVNGIEFPLKTIQHG